MERPPILLAVDPSIKAFEKAVSGNANHAAFLEGLLKRARLGDSISAIPTWSMALFLVQLFFLLKMGSILLLRTDRGEVALTSEEEARIRVSEVVAQWELYNEQAGQPS